MELNYWDNVTADQVREAYKIGSDSTPTEILLHFIDTIAGVNLWESKNFTKDSHPHLWTVQQINNLPFNGSFETLPFSEFIYLQETMRNDNALTCDFGKVKITNTVFEKGSALWQFSTGYAFAKFCQQLPDRFDFMSVDEGGSNKPAFGVPSSAWFSTLYALSDGDIYKSERIGEMPCGFVFRWLTESERRINKIE
jgi:hypothetical protein